MQYENEHARSDAQVQHQTSEITASRSQRQKQSAPAVISATIAILLIVHGFFIGGLLVLEVAFMSSCSRTILRFFWSLVWTFVLAGYFYYWLIFVAS